MAKTIFERIIAREIPAEIVFEDNKCLAFRDIAPQAPVHILVIPKKKIRCWADIGDDDAGLIGHMAVVIRNIASEQQLADGYRVVCNSGPDGGQTVDYLHFHLLGGRGLHWPPG